MPRGRRDRVVSRVIGIVKRCTCKDPRLSIARIDVQVNVPVLVLQESIVKVIRTELAQ